MFSGLLQVIGAAAGLLTIAVVCYTIADDWKNRRSKVWLGRWSERSEATSARLIIRRDWTRLAAFAHGLPIKAMGTIGARQYIFSGYAFDDEARLEFREKKSVRNVGGVMVIRLHQRDTSRAESKSAFHHHDEGLLKSTDLAWVRE